MRSRGSSSSPSILGLTDYSPAATATDGWLLAGVMTGGFVTAFTTYIPAGNMIVLPFVPTVYSVVDKLGCDVHDGHGATTKARMGIYATAANSSLPGALVLDFGEVTMSAAGLNTWTAGPVTLQKGKPYHVGILVTSITGGSGPRFYRIIETQMCPYYGSPDSTLAFYGRSPVWGVKQTGLGVGGLPNPFPGGATYLGSAATAALAIAMGIRFAS